MNRILKINKILIKSLTISSIFLLIWSVILISKNITDQSSNYYFALLAAVPFFIAGIAGVLNWSKIGRQSTTSKSLLYVGLSQLSYATGVLFWSYYIFFKDIEIPYPSFADFFFLLMTPFWVLALINVIKIFEARLEKKDLIQAFFIFLIISGITMNLFGSPDISKEYPFWENFFNLAYTLADGIMMGVAIVTLKLVGGKMFKGLSLILSSVILLVISDFVFVYRTDNEIYWNGDIADFLYILSAAVAGYGILLTAKIILERRQTN